MSNIHFELFKFMNEHGDKTQDVRKSVMTDREKVIKSLELCADGHHCHECSYQTVKHNLDGIADCTSLLADHALELLKKHEAVEPYITGNGESFETAETWWYECGNCNKPIDPNDKFCRYCGREVKWE